MQYPIHVIMVIEFVNKRRMSISYTAADDNACDGMPHGALYGT